MVHLTDGYQAAATDDNSEAIKAQLNRLEEDTAETVLSSFLTGLDTGTIRAAAPDTDGWTATSWVKQGILAVFAHADNAERAGNTTDVLPLRDTTGLTNRGVRITPGATVRAGVHLGDNVTVMGGAYVNIGTWVGERSMVDSNVTVGSCAQIGTDTHIGANTLIGGVLEPVEDTPVIIGDEVSIGGGSVITSGFEVGDGTVVAEDTLLTPRIEVYDLVDETVYHGHVKPDRRVFRRQLPSSLGEHELFAAADLEVTKPVAVAIERGASPVEFEETLRVKSD